METWGKPPTDFKPSQLKAAHVPCLHANQGSFALAHARPANARPPLAPRPLPLKSVHSRYKAAARSSPRTAITRLLRCAPLNAEPQVEAQPRVHQEQQHGGTAQVGVLHKGGGGGGVAK